MTKQTPAQLTHLNQQPRPSNKNSRPPLLPPYLWLLPLMVLVLCWQEVRCARVCYVRACVCVSNTCWATLAGGAVCVFVC